MIPIPQIYGGKEDNQAMGCCDRFENGQVAFNECGLERNKCPFFLEPDYCVKYSTGSMKKTLERILKWKNQFIFAVKISTML